MILQVLSHARQIVNRRNARGLQLIRRTDPRQHEQLRRIYGPARQDHFAPGKGPLGVAAAGGLGLADCIAQAGELSDVKKALAPLFAVALDSLRRLRSRNWVSHE